MSTNHLFGTEEFDEQEKKIIRRLLTQKLGGSHLSMRPGAAKSWKAIELANSIFGFDGWSSQIVDITPDFIEQIQGGKFRVGVTAVVKVMLKDGTFHEDVGYGTAIENAKKEAVSDARKRALRIFGNALGNCIYDKEHIKKVKSKINSSASGTVSYDQLRANLGTVDDLSQTQPPTPTPSRQETENKNPTTSYPPYQQQGPQYTSGPSDSTIDVQAYDYQQVAQGETDDGLPYTDPGEDQHVPEEEGAAVYDEQTSQWILQKTAQPGLPKTSPPQSQQTTTTTSAPPQRQFATFNRPFKTNLGGTTTAPIQTPFKRTGLNTATAKR